MSLADLLGPLVVLTAYHVRNYKHLVETLSTVMIEEDEVFASRSVCIHKNPYITQTSPCNILQYFTAIKMIIFR